MPCGPQEFCLTKWENCGQGLKMDADDREFVLQYKEDTVWDIRGTEHSECSLAVNNIKKWIRKNKNNNNPYVQPDKKAREMRKDEIKANEKFILPAKQDELKAWRDSGSINTVKWDSFTSQ